MKSDLLTTHTRRRVSDRVRTTPDTTTMSLIATNRRLDTLHYVPERSPILSTPVRPISIYEEQYQRNPQKAHPCASPRRLSHQA